MNKDIRQYFNKGISIPLALGMVVFIVAVAGAIIWYVGNTKFSALTSTPSPTPAPNGQEPYVKLVSPNGGETWVTGEMHEIKWETNISESVVSLILVNNDVPGTSVAKSWQKDDIPNTGSYKFIVPKSISGDNFTMYIDIKNYNDDSDNVFGIDFSYEDKLNLAVENKDESFCYGNSACLAYMAKFKNNIFICEDIDQELFHERCFTYFEQKGQATADLIVEYQDQSEWQTYRNEEYGFELKYPSDMDLSVRNYANTEFYLGAFANCMDNDNSYGCMLIFSIEIFDYSGDSDLRLWIEANEPCGYRCLPYGQDISIAGTSGIYLDKVGTCPPGASSAISVYYITFGQDLYRIAINAEAGDCEENSVTTESCVTNPESLLKSIISTLKFID